MNECSTLALLPDGALCTFSKGARNTLDDLAWTSLKKMPVAAVYGKEYAASCSCALVKCGSCVNGGGKAKAKFILFKYFLSDYE